MNSILYDCIDSFLVVHLNDILVYSKTREEHLQHLRVVLNRLKDNELYVGRDNFELLQTETEFLELRVGSDGISIDKERKRVVKEWPKPTKTTELHSFVGLLQFFRRFIRGFSVIAAPLTDLTRKNGGIRKWGASCDNAFDNLKQLLIQAPIMMPPDWSKPFQCHTDASLVAVGGTLTQYNDFGEKHVIANFSKRLSPAEKNYSASDCELLGLIYFLQRFRCYLEGSSFDAFYGKPDLALVFHKTYSQSLRSSMTRLSWPVWHRQIVPCEGQGSRTGRCTLSYPSNTCTRPRGQYSIQQKAEARTAVQFQIELQIRQDVRTPNPRNSRLLTP